MREVAEKEVKKEGLKNKCERKRVRQQYWADAKPVLFPSCCHVESSGVIYFVAIVVDVVVVNVVVVIVVVVIVVVVIVVVAADS